MLTYFSKYNYFYAIIIIIQLEEILHEVKQRESNDAEGKDWPLMMDRLCACCVQSSRLCTAHSRLWQMASLVTSIQVPSVAPQVTLRWYPTMECPLNLQSRDTKKAVPPPGREEGILENCRGCFGGHNDWQGQHHLVGGRQGCQTSKNAQDGPTK